MMTTGKKAVKKSKTIKKDHIFVATPMYGGMCTGFYTQSVMRLQHVMNGRDTDVSFAFMFNESLITRARNSLANGFLKSNATHLLFIDADIRFNPEDVPHMMDVNKDIIVGIYPKKEINWGSVATAVKNDVATDDLGKYTGSWVVNLVDYAGSVTVPVNEPLEIFAGGTGFMLIKRKVFEELKGRVPTYTNDVVDLSNSMKPQDVIHEFFATSIEPETNRLLSEDYHFCRTWRLNGGKIYAAPWVQLGHVGSYLIDGKLM